MEKKKVWGVLKTPLKIMVTGGLLYFVFQKIDLEEVQGVYRQSNPVYFLLAVFAFLCSQVVSSWRLLGFFRAKGLVLPFVYNLKLYFLGMFYNLFLPGGIGGDGYKLYLLRTRFSFSGKKLLSAIFLDRLSGLWALACIAITLLLFIPAINISPVLPVAAFLTGSVIYFYILSKLFDLPLAVAAAGHLKALVVQSFQLASVIMLLLAINFSGKFAPYLLTFLVSSLVAIFPFTIGGLGAREYVFILAAGALAMDKNLAVSLSLSFYLVSALVALGGVYFVFRDKEFSQIPDKQELEKSEQDALAPARNA